MKTNEIFIRDPFVLTYEGVYYMYGTRVSTKKGFDVYKSTDLENWSTPVSVFDAHEGFWGTKEFWAPEVHRYRGRFYMFATFNSEDRHRGCQILVSDRPDEKFEVWSEIITTEDWNCLDGTLYIEDGTPYMVFCHEWTQIKDGEIWAVKLTDDLKASAGEPFLLWKASEAKWVTAYDKPDSGDYITDGPFLYRDKNGMLCSLWSSFCKTGYAVAKAYSDNGKLNGRWINEDKPLLEKDGGHGMLFKTFDNKTMLSIHIGNGHTGTEHPYFIEFDD